MSTASVDLYAVAERSVFSSDRNWLEALAAVAHLNLPGLAIQVRLKQEPPARAADLSREAREVTRGSSAPVFLNGATEQALQHGYTGVHWPEAGIPASIDTAGLLKGASVHSPDAAARAEAAGAGFLVAGPIFDAGSKPVAGTGLQPLRDIVCATTLPVLAIGGITPRRIAACIEAGASGVAIVTGIFAAADIAGAVRDYREALDEAFLRARSAV